MNKKCFMLSIMALCLNFAHAQYIQEKTAPINNLAVPFLLLSVDAVTSGMGEAGSALVIGTDNLESGISKLAFVEQKFGINITYTPWLRKLVNDRRLMYAGGFYKLNEGLVLATSVNFLSYGQIDLANNENVSLGSVKPNEFVFGLGISKRFGADFSLGMKAKLVSSNMYNGSGNNFSIQNGTSYCVDISAVHLFPLPNLHQGSSFAVSLNILNIGPKISYSNQAEQKFYLPTSLRIGTALKIEDLSEDTFSIALDASKLLVPASSVTDSKSVVSGIFSALGNGIFAQDIGCSIGAEYAFKKKVAVRMGYNLQNSERLLGSFFSLGAGVKQKNVSINLSYLMANPQKTFLSNTMRFSLGYAIF